MTKPELSPTRLRYTHAAKEEQVRGLRRLYGSRLAKNTAWMLAAYSLRTVLQAGYFIVIARLLGPRGYGAFIGAVALVAILVPFASLGFGNIMVKNVARSPSTFPRSWGNAIVVSMVNGAILTVGVIGLARLVLPRSIPLILVLFVAVADLVFTPLLDLSAQAFQAVEKLSKMAQLLVISSTSKLVGSFVLLTIVKSPSAVDWSLAYLLAGVAASLMAVILVTRRFGLPMFDPRSVKRDLREGFHFATSLSALSIYNDIDKTLLTRLATLQAAGIYAAAYRVVDVAFSPVRSLLSATYGRFFKHGEGGIDSGLKLALRLLPMAVGYSALVGACLFAAADVLPRVLGTDYKNASGALRWLAPLPLLRSFHTFAADTLTGSGYQKLRSRFQIGVAFVNVGLCFALIPAYSWRGAAWASLASDGLLALCLWWAVGRLLRKTRFPRPADSASEAIA